MWDCEHCGCQAIAGTITTCPVCGTPRPTQDVPAEPSGPSASATTNDDVVDREAPQEPALSEPGQASQLNVAAEQDEEEVGKVSNDGKEWDEK